MVYFIFTVFIFYLQHYAQTQLDEQKILTQGFTPLVPSKPSTPLPLSSAECATPNRDMLRLSATNQSHNMVLDNTILVTSAVMITTSCTTTTNLVRPAGESTPISQASLNKISSKIERQKKEASKKNKKLLDKASPSDIICVDNTNDSRENKVSNRGVIRMRNVRFPISDCVSVVNHLHHHHHYHHYHHCNTVLSPITVT